jgi:CheY-like chemotaxis protein
MIVDDEPEIHQVTRFALANNLFQEKPITFISAYSAEEAKSLLIKHPDIALIFLDVVMETNQSGLQLTRYIRNTLKNDRVQIIIVLDSRAKHLKKRLSRIMILMTTDSKWNARSVSYMLS